MIRGRLHIYSVQLDGSGFKALTTEEGMHFGNFSDDGKHYTHMYLGPQSAPSISLCCGGRALQSGVGGAKFNC